MIAPTFPVKVITPLLFPAHTVALGPVEPGVDPGATFTCNTLLVSSIVHPKAAPSDCTITRTAKVSLTLKKFIEGEVISVSIQILSLTGEVLYCHFLITPVHVAIVIETSVPAHTLLLPDNGPASGLLNALMVIVSTEGVQPASLVMRHCSL